MVDSADAIKARSKERGRTVLDIAREVADRYDVELGSLLHLALSEAALEGYALGSRHAMQTLSNLLDKSLP